MDLEANYSKSWELFNPNEPLESLYTRLNKWVDCAIAADKIITEGQVAQITYGLVAEMGHFQEDCQTWRAKSEHNKTWMGF